MDIYFLLDNVRPYYYNGNMAHLHKKIKKGRPYYYIREIARVGGKPKVVNQVYLGSLERIMQMAQKEQEPRIKLQVQEFGGLWLANLIDQEIDFAGIVDSVVPKGKNETGPTVGEYFLYAAFNRMVDTCSKRAFPQWFKDSAVNQIRPVDSAALTSQRFWDKWDRVGQTEIEEAAWRFFHKIAQLQPPGQGCFLFDTTNYYTYMASENESALAQRGKNKDGKNWLRQVGLALLVSRETGLPMYYREYNGNQHDSKLFGDILEPIASNLSELVGHDADLTVVVDKGMNAEENMEFIDQRDHLHFITTYSTYFSPELTAIDLKRFQPVDNPKNKALREMGKGDEQLLAFRTTGEYWSRERTVVVTYNPRSARKQRYQFERKLLRLRQELYAMQAKMRAGLPKWRAPKEIEKRYRAFCEKLYITKTFYELSFERLTQGWQMSFRKNPKTFADYTSRFGKNIIVTDHHYWSTEEIVKVSLDRWMVESSFRQSKDKDLVSALPIRHWTDSKIRCHFLSCVVALTYLELIEHRVKNAGLDLTASAAINHMRQLHSCLCWINRKRKPTRIIEQPSQTQAQILKAFNYKVTPGGVLQTLSA
jgi:transposase